MVNPSVRSSNTGFLSVYDQEVDNRCVFSSQCYLLVTYEQENATFHLITPIEPFLNLHGMIYTETVPIHEK